MRIKKTWLLRSGLTLLVLVFLSLSGFILYCILFRYPTDHELREKFPAFSDPNYVINTEQADIGWISVENKQGESQYIELSPQWVMPWESYDWAKGGYSEETGP